MNFGQNPRDNDMEVTVFLPKYGSLLLRLNPIIHNKTQWFDNKPPNEHIWALRNPSMYLDHHIVRVPLPLLRTTDKNWGYQLKQNCRKGTSVNWNETHEPLMIQNELKRASMTVRNKIQNTKWNTMRSIDLE